MRWTWIVVGVLAASGCEKKKSDEKKLDGPMPVTFGDCAGATTAWVSGPRPAPFTPTDADFIWVDDAATKTASADTPPTTPEPHAAAPPADDPPPPEADDKQGDDNDSGGRGTTRGPTRGPTGAGSATASRDDGIAKQRKEAIEAARASGILGSMASDPTMSGAFASMTLDDTSVAGTMLGPDVSFGPGGFSGPGTGGGGMGIGSIGTGRYGTIGHGSGYGVGGRPGAMRAHDPHLPTVTLGEPNVVGDLDKAIIRRYIKRNIQKLTYCYEKQLLVKPDLEGTVSVQFFITPAGEVATSTASGIDPAVSTCAADVIKAIVFPTPKGDSGVQVNYPFTFNKPEQGLKPTTPDPAEASAPTDTTVAAGGASGTGAGKSTPPSPTARRRLFREAGTYDRTYKPGAANPLASDAKGVEDCLRLGTTRHGVAVVELTYDGGSRKVSDVIVHGIDDKRVSECIVKIAKKTTNAPGTPTQRCSLSYGEMAFGDLPTIDINQQSVMLATRELAKTAELAETAPFDPTVPSIVDAVKARVTATTAQTAPIVSVHGPLAIRAEDATKMSVVKRVIASVLAGGDDFVLVAKQNNAWALVEPLALPVVPAPFGTGGPWNHVRVGRGGAAGSALADQPYAILLDEGEQWVGTNAGAGEVLAQDGSAPKRLRDILVGFKKARPTAELHIGARDGITYGTFVRTIAVAREAGFADWQLVNASSITKGN